MWAIATPTNATGSTGRCRRVTLLTDALTKISGPAAVPLLTAFPMRALLAAQNPAAGPAITRHD